MHFINVTISSIARQGSNPSAQGKYIFDTIGFSFQATVTDYAEGDEYLPWILTCELQGGSPPEVNIRLNVCSYHCGTLAAKDSLG
jgi:hypothetical protein